MTTQTVQSDYFSPWHVCKGHCRGGTVFQDGACVPKADPDNPGSCLPAYSPGMNCIKIGLPGKLILNKRKGFLKDNH